MKNSDTLVVEIILRIGVFLTFLGHGAFAIQGKESWLPYLTYFGFTTAAAFKLMFLIGVVDFIVAISVLFKPYKPIIIWAVFWAFSTALIRPITGASIFDFIERGLNWLAPLALYFIIGNKLVKNTALIK